MLRVVEGVLLVGTVFDGGISQPYPRAYACNECNPSSAAGMDSIRASEPASQRWER